MKGNTLIKSFRRSFVALAKVKPAQQQVPLAIYERERRQDDFYIPFGLERPEERYKYETKIGEGHFASVYLGTDTFTSRQVAVKVVDKKRVHKQVFKQELRVMEQIKSALGQTGLLDSALAVHSDVVESKTELKFIFDLYSGGDLCDDLIDNGAMSEGEIRDMLKRLLPSLRAMHDNGFVHRDIKAENVLLNKEPDRSKRYKSVTLADFGYARKLNETDQFSNPAGTFGFVAPEVLSTKFYSTACDVWSLGAVLFTAKAAYQPFPHLESDNSLQGKTSQNLARKELNSINHYTTEQAWNDEMSKPEFASASPEFKDLLKRMLTVDHTERITVDEILAHPFMTM